MDTPSGKGEVSWPGQLVPKSRVDPTNQLGALSPLEWDLGHPSPCHLLLVLPLELEDPPPRNQPSKFQNMGWGQGLRR